MKHPVYSRNDMYYSVWIKHSVGEMRGGQQGQQDQIVEGLEQQVEDSGSYLIVTSITITNPDSVLSHKGYPPNQFLGGTLILHHALNKLAFW